jgi:4-hydroxy-tetrahydrodipicolinate reductase
MNIALIGYGKMGKEIEKIAIARNHTIKLIIDINNPQDLNNDNLKDIDVAIEFTVPHTAIDNYKKCFEANVPVVTGTTGWLDSFNEIKEICQKERKGFFFTPNYSLGVNIFFKVNRFLAKIMNGFTDYDVKMTEVHHTQKLDAPSGTAINLANDIIAELDRKSKYQLDDQHDNPDALVISAVREGQVPGIHIIKYESPMDFIEITHSAKTRQGFALGAVLAAEFMQGKKGVYSMDDLLNF